MRNALRILLVDDDEDEYILARTLLADRPFGPPGFILDWVPTYEAALRAFAERRYDIYLVDYQLGDRDGLELLRQAQQMGCPAPIILLTGQGSYAVDIEAMKAGATDYLVKGEVTAPLLERSIRYALERKRTEAQIRKDAFRAELLATLSQSFAEASLKYPQVLDTVTRQIAKSTGDACIIHLLSEDQEWLDPASFHHPDPGLHAAIDGLLNANRLRADEGLAGRALDSGQPGIFRVSDASNPDSPDLRPWPDGLPMHSALVVLLRAEGRFLGTLALIRFQPDNPYQSDDLVFFQDLAGRAALAIKNALLFTAEASRARELDALHKATAALLNTIDLKLLLGHILDIATSAIPAAEKSMLYLIAQDTGELQMRAASGFQDARIQRVDLGRAQGYLARSIIRAVGEREPLLLHHIPDESSETGCGGSPDLSSIRSAVIAPLILEGKTVGALSLSAMRPAAFTPADLRLLVSFATTTTAAIQNALLHAEVQKLALTDSLTGLYNRRGFYELGRHEMERARRFRRPLAAMMIDIDHFKLVNDTFGHAIGDQVLLALAGRLRASLREVDVLGRYGGEEFAILLPETDLFTASGVAERLRNYVTEPMPLQLPHQAGAPLAITASFGIANSVTTTHDLSGLLERADMALYAAKRNGRNRIEVA